MYPPLACPSGGRIPEGAGRGRAIHPGARHPSPETRRESHREKVRSKAWADYVLKGILFQGVKIRAIEEWISYSAASGSAPWRFPARRVDCLPTGCENAGGAGFFGYFADLPSSAATESNMA